MRIFIIKGSIRDLDTYFHLWDVAWFKDEALAKKRAEELGVLSDGHSIAVNAKRNARTARKITYNKAKQDIRDNAGNGMTFAGAEAREAFYDMKLKELGLPPTDEPGEWEKIRGEEDHHIKRVRDELKDPNWQPDVEYTVEPLEQGDE